MMRWLKRIALILITAFVAAYIGDSVIFRLRGAPQSKVTVNHSIAIPLKGNKQEFDYLGSTDQPCAVALFPQAGLDPCWHLRRNTNQITAM
jgi:hypothetical protein